MCNIRLHQLVILHTPQILEQPHLLKVLLRVIHQFLAQLCLLINKRLVFGQHAPLFLSFNHLFHCQTQCPVLEECALRRQQAEKLELQLLLIDAVYQRDTLDHFYIQKVVIA